MQRGVRQDKQGRRVQRIYLILHKHLPAQGDRHQKLHALVEMRPVHVPRIVPAHLQIKRLHLHARPLLPPLCPNMQIKQQNNIR
ncbi:hypothetical protein SDC9_106013 [bioreactor metagenome]|uniref:Uncharacterized protein n=1 Tax=bioreactor metagenome TaxID=1076179 RepID=A0A645BBT7_9ZZZZ